MTNSLRLSILRLILIQLISIICVVLYDWALFEMAVIYLVETAAIYFVFNINHYFVHPKTRYHPIQALVILAFSVLLFGFLLWGFSIAAFYITQGENIDGNKEILQNVFVPKMKEMEIPYLFFTFLFIELVVYYIRISRNKKYIEKSFWNAMSRILLSYFFITGGLVILFFLQNYHWLVISLFIVLKIIIEIYTQERRLLNTIKHWLMDKAKVKRLSKKPKKERPVARKAPPVNPIQEAVTKPAKPAPKARMVLFKKLFPFTPPNTASRPWYHIVKLILLNVVTLIGVIWFDWDLFEIGILYVLDTTVIYFVFELDSFFIDKKTRLPLFFALLQLSFTSIPFLGLMYFMGILTKYITTGTFNPDSFFYRIEHMHFWIPGIFFLLSELIYYYTRKAHDPDAVAKNIWRIFRRILYSQIFLVISLVIASNVGNSLWFSVLVFMGLKLVMEYSGEDARAFIFLKKIFFPQKSRIKGRFDRKKAKPK